jgi:hypothetical protein
MTPHPLESGERRPDMNMTALVVMGFVAIPEARPFLLASGLCGSLLGLILYRKHR